MRQPVIKAKGDDRLNLSGQMVEHRRVVLALEEPAAGRGLAEHPDFTGHEAERMAQGASTAVHRLRYGSKGPLVTRVQEALKAKGFYEGRIDDDFGIRTLRAVLRFQTTEFGIWWRRRDHRCTDGVGPRHRVARTTGADRR